MALKISFSKQKGNKPDKMDTSERIGKKYYACIYIYTTHWGKQWQLKKKTISWFHFHCEQFFVGFKAIES